MGKKIEWFIKKYMVFFLILTVSAAGYCGFFSKWAFRDGASSMGVTAMLEETARRPFIHRQLLPQTAKYVASVIPVPAKENLEKKLSEGRYIESRYAEAHIPRQYIIEYYLMYTFCFLAFFASIWILRSLLSEITKDKVAGTLGAMLFAVIFPFFEVLGGYYYDIFELLFMFWGSRLALHGNYVGLLLLAPVAEANKESFLFFLATLYPLNRTHFSLRKAMAITAGTILVAGLTYLYIRQLYVGNPGDMADWRIMDHLKNMFQLEGYFYTTSIYGLPLGEGWFLPHVLCVFLIVRKGWHYMSAAWREHAKIALVINGILYFMFVLPDEIRDLSLLYVSFMILTAFFIRDVIKKNYRIE